MYDLGVRRPVLRNRNAQPNRLYKVPNPEYFRLLEERGIRVPGGTGFGAGGGGPSLTGSGTGGGGLGGGPSLGAGGPGVGPGGGSEPESGDGGLGLGGGLGTGGGVAGGGGIGGGQQGPIEIKDAQGNVVPPNFPAPKFDFVVQFAWKPGELEIGRAHV